jgi:poly(A) polymerase/tRNA nucleotidyltransferase (CCA-adding enzyme)
MKMLTSAKPSTGIELMRKSGLLSIYMPELEDGIGVGQPKPFHKEDVYLHSIHTCDRSPVDKPILRLAALLHDVSKPECKKGMTFYDHEAKGAQIAAKIMKRLKFSNNDIEYAANLIRNHMFNYSGEWSGAAVRRFIGRVGLKNLDDLFALRVADIRAMGRKMEPGHPAELRGRIKKILADQNALHLRHLKVNGNDVMRILDMPPGPKVGETLNMVLEKVLEEPSLNTKIQLTKLIEELK